MKTEDYINSLINERDNLKEICKSHAETIRFIKKELLKKDKKINKLEKDSLNIKIQNELDIIKSELNALKEEYDELQHKYNDVVKENKELKIVLDVIENMSDSD